MKVNFARNRWRCELRRWWTKSTMLTEKSFKCNFDCQIAASKKKKCTHIRNWNLLVKASHRWKKRNKWKVQSNTKRLCDGCTKVSVANRLWLASSKKMNRDKNIREGIWSDFDHHADDSSRLSFVIISVVVFHFSVRLCYPTKVENSLSDLYKAPTGLCLTTTINSHDNTWLDVHTVGFGEQKLY